ncbi:hypothetical protein [Anaerorhabdus sp.]|uniref:hypothetical protein n=1 Tax=Anaerorhabdus sp. TaxID=1872524 RepID=UPI002FC84EE1
MKKSNFVAMILTTVSTVFFGLGMVMTLQPELGLYNEGMIFGVMGIIAYLITILVWRKMEHLPAIKITGKGLLIILLSIVGALGLGLGMVNVMVWDHLMLGVFVGLIGIFVLLSLIPIWKGIH